jgi:hypothetical protein
MTWLLLDPLSSLDSVRLYSYSAVSATASGVIPREPKEVAAESVVHFHQDKEASCFVHGTRNSCVGKCG